MPLAVGRSNLQLPWGYTQGLHQRPLECSKALFYGAFSKPFYYGGEGGIRTPDTVSPVRRIQLQNSCASRDANCGHEIKLTESLAAPLLEETRRRFQEQMRRNMPRLPPRSKRRDWELGRLRKAGSVFAWLGDVVGRVVDQQQIDTPSARLHVSKKNPQTKTQTKREF